MAGGSNRFLSEAQSRVGRWLKRYHMIHHHTGIAARYGVSSPLWDYVFRTTGEEQTSA